MGHHCHWSFLVFQFDCLSTVCIVLLVLCSGYFVMKDCCLLKANGCFLSVSSCVVLLHVDYSRAYSASKWIRVSQFQLGIVVNSLLLIFTSY